MSTTKCQLDTLILNNSTIGILHGRIRDSFMDGEVNKNEFLFAGDNFALVIQKSEISSLDYRNDGSAIISI